MVFILVATRVHPEWLRATPQHEVRMIADRPHRADLVLVAAAQPITDPIAENGARHGSHAHRPGIDRLQADQHAAREHDRAPGKPRADQRQRFGQR